MPEMPPARATSVAAGQTTTSDFRAAGHVARRAMTVYGPQRCNRPSPAAHTAPAAERVVRAALLARLGRRALPKGAPDLPRRLAEVVLATRAPVAEARPPALRLRDRRRRLYLAEVERVPSRKGFLVDAHLQDRRP